MSERTSSNYSRDLITVMTAFTIISCTAVISMVLFDLNDRNNMAKNIESAIASGVDPLSVKCAYETDPNPICITYSMANFPSESSK